MKLGITLLGPALVPWTLACTSVDSYPITGADSSLGNEAGTSAAGGEAGAPSAGEAGTSAVGCEAAPLPVGDWPQKVVVDGMTRSYLLHVPPNYDATRRAPLVLDFHGIGETGASERASSPYPDVLDAEGAVMAFPDGLRGPAGNGWNVGPCCVADVDDVAFARAVVADARTRACVDSARIYAVGVLTGGGMAHYLGCHAADIFAAVAPAAFDLLEENEADCQPSRPISVVSFRSTADPRVPYEGGESSLVPGMPLTFLGAEATFAKWAAIDGCSTEPTSEDANGCAAYARCAGDAEVILCTREGQEQHAEANVAWAALRRHTLD